MSGPYPHTVKIQRVGPGSRAVVMSWGTGDNTCQKAATLDRVTDGGRGVRVGPAKGISQGVYCPDESGGSSFALDGSGGLLRTPPNGIPDTNPFTRG